MIQFGKRRQLLGILLFCNLLSITAQTNNKATYKDSNKLELTGIIPGLINGEMALLSIWDAKLKNRVVIDSSTVKDGKFHLRHYIDRGPRLFWVQFSKHRHIISLPLDNEKVIISYDKSIDSIQDQSAFQYLRTDGSKIAKQFLYLGYALRNTWYYSRNKIDGSILAYKDSTMNEVNLSHIAGLLKARDLLNKTVGEILLTQPVQEVTPEFFDNLPVHFQRDSFFIGVYNNLDQKIKESYYGEIMKEKIELCNGQMAPDFTFNTVDGKAQNLKEIVQKNKLTLLHFWSNNSTERKRIHGELSEAYKKYHNKGLEVISVSLDANPEKWKRIIKDDHIPGYQTCDFKEEESPIAILYKMDPKNTVNILIDQNGKMIAWDVDGPKLFGHLFNLFDE